MKLDPPEGPFSQPERLQAGRAAGERDSTRRQQPLVVVIAEGLEALARSAAGLQAFRLGERPFWGIQFHPEVTLEDLSSWLDNWQTDPGAVATGLDPEAIRAESAEKIGGWNDVGRGISARFLAAAAGALLER
jgi:hypothetical protein